jgi:GT2 family glycosyltransferase
MQRVLAAGGNGVIHRREVFEVVGLYDEDYYAMFEDIDFSLRSLFKGKRCLYIPDTSISHKVGLCRQTQVSHEAEMAWEHNRAMMAAKTLPIPLLVVGILVLCWREFRLTFPLRPQNYRLFTKLTHRSVGRARAHLEGLRKGWAKRRSIWKTRTASRAEIYRWLLRGEGPV